MSSPLDKIYERMVTKGEIKPKLPKVAQDDIAGAIENFVRDIVARELHGLPKPPGEKPLSQRIEQLQRHMEKAYKGVEPAAPSHVDPPTPVSVPGPAIDMSKGMTVLHRDPFGRISHVKMPNDQVWEVSQRDEFGRIVKVQPVEV